MCSSRSHVGNQQSESASRGARKTRFSLEFLCSDATFDAQPRIPISGRGESTPLLGPPAMRSKAVEIVI